MAVEKKHYKWFSRVLLLLVFLCVFFHVRNGVLQRRYIFIDGGAHKGETVAHFVESKIYQKHSWEIFAFEANPHLIPEIPPRANLTVLNKAIWNKEGTIEFFLGDDTLSSSLLKDKKTGNLSKIPVKVDSVDFGQWLKKRFELKDYIFVKLDIEGAEYEVLDKMLADGTIAYVDRLYVEFHNVKVNVPVEKDKDILARLKKLDIVVRQGRSNTPGDWFQERKLDPNKRFILLFSGFILSVIILFIIIYFKSK